MKCQYSEKTVNEVLLVILLGGHELKQASESYLILNASAGLAHPNSFISDKQVLLVLSSPLYRFLGNESTNFPLLWDLAPKDILHLFLVYEK